MRLESDSPIGLLFDDAALQHAVGYQIVLLDQNCSSFLLYPEQVAGHTHCKFVRFWEVRYLLGQVINTTPCWKP